MTPATLITIPFSHYCEKSRWMLDLAAIPYTEDGHVPMLHRRATRPHKGSSVPVLVTEDGVFSDSSDIALWVDGSYPLLATDPDERREALALEDDFDLVLGPHLRRLMYFHLLSSKKTLHAMMALCPPSEARMARFMMLFFKGFMRRSLKLTPKGAARSLALVHESFEAVASRLSDGRSFLVGDTVGLADLTFAALASPILMPPEHPLPWPSDAILPAPILALRDELRGTPAGAFVMRLYRDHRRADETPLTAD